MNWLYGVIFDVVIVNSQLQSGHIPCQERHRVGYRDNVGYRVGYTKIFLRISMCWL